MSKKVVLNTGYEHTVTLVAKQSEIQLCIAFVNVTDEDVLRKQCTADAMTKVKSYEEDNSYVTYENFVSFDHSFTTDNNDGTKNVAMYFNFDSQNTRIANLEQQVNGLYDGLLSILTEVIPGLKIGL